MHGLSTSNVKLSIL